MHTSDWVVPRKAGGVERGARCDVTHPVQKVDVIAAVGEEQAHSVHVEGLICQRLPLASMDLDPIVEAPGQGLRLRDEKGLGHGALQVSRE